jgi:hypothetical protein
MVQIEIFGREFFSTILADVLVSLVNVLSGKFYLPGREFIINQEEDNARYLEIITDSSDYVAIIGCIPGKILPVLETKGIERTPILYYYLCVLQVK